MRTLLRVVTDINTTNIAVANGSLQTIIKETIDRLQPESTYFHTENGNRACFMVFDLKDVADIPSIAEPFFHHFNAKVEFSPVMNLEDLQKGLKSALSTRLETASI